MTDHIEMEEERKPRPGFLTVLCVLSFISIGITLLSGVVGLATGPQSSESMLEQKVELTKMKTELANGGVDMGRMIDQIIAMSEQTNDSFYLANGLGLFVALIGLVSVIMMWRGRKVGFHGYIIYSLLSIGAAYLYVSPANVPTLVVVFNVVISGLFIFLYSRNLHWMNQ